MSDNLFMASKPLIELPEGYDKRQSQVPGEVDFWKHSFIAALHHYGLAPAAASIANQSVEELRKKIADMA